ncbi:MAG: hydrogenase nickel incorporation protein HypB [Candidatus Omnitrophica bacterium]|nr:hydrogenase nickel incorporation protein HypB [Candidatus Omnitrophota bacterium]
MAFKVIKEDIIKANDNVADDIRKKMKEHNVLMLNMISSPGSGKTSLLEKIGPMLKKMDVNAAIVAGDCFTSRDAERLNALDIEVVQINTGNSCHIDAQLVAKSLEGMDFDKLDLIIVENVGNLVCPAEFDIGEDHKIAVFSTAEGEDKPIKYPLLVKESIYGIINKIDLLPYTDFNIDFFRTSIKKLNPNMKIVETSCKTGLGLEELAGWIKEKTNEKKETPR